MRPPRGLGHLARNLVQPDGLAGSEAVMKFLACRITPAEYAAAARRAGLHRGIL